MSVAGLTRAPRSRARRAIVAVLVAASVGALSGAVTSPSQAATVDYSGSLTTASRMVISKGGTYERTLVPSGSVTAAIDDVAHTVTSGTTSFGSSQTDTFLGPFNSWFYVETTLEQRGAITGTAVPTATAGVSNLSVATVQRLHVVVYKVASQTAPHDPAHDQKFTLYERCWTDINLTLQGTLDQTTGGMHLAQDPFTIPTFPADGGDPNDANHRCQTATDSLNQQVAGPHNSVDLVFAGAATTVPGTPTIGTASAGNQQATVTWTAPSATGGTPITGYVVTPYVGAAAQTPVVFGTTATSQAITGLTNGTAYTFRVAAKNAVGTGPGSAASNAVTPVQVCLPFGTLGAFVDRQYHDLLGRVPTATERSTAVSALTTGSVTCGGFIAQQRLSTDHLANVDPVTRLYRAYFLRIPDQGGLTYWIGQKRSGARDLSAISNGFAASKEFTSRYGALSNRAFVNLVYQNVLGRPGEASGVDYWTGQLDQRLKSRGQVMIGFSESSEYKNQQHAQVDASVLPIMMLGRAPTSSEFSAAVAALQGSTTVAAYAAQILGSPEYATHVGA